MPNRRSNASRLTAPYAVVLAMFFLSGATALLYEVAWFRRLQLVFGVSVFAIGAVVAAFMAGLAVGSRWAASRNSMAAALRRRPLSAYAALELAIAAYAVAFPFIVGVSERAYASLFEPLHGQFLLLSILRFTASLVLLLPATFCMGATLPTLARVVVHDEAGASRRIGWLYAVNTLGGVAGTLGAGFLLLEHFGIRGTIWLGAVVNLLIAGVAIGLQRRHPELNKGREEAPRPEMEPAPAITGRRNASFQRLGFVLLVVGITGLASMALEVLWTRALVFYVHNSTYAFSAILSVYLLGLGGGAAVGSRLSAGRHAAPWLVGTLCVIPIACLASIAVYRALPALAQSLLGETLDPDLSGFPDTDFRVVRSWSTAMAAIFLQVGAVLLIPAFLFGLVFPLALRIGQKDQPDPARWVGRLYAANTVGAVAGTVLGSFVLVPLLGTRGSLIFLAWCTVPVAFLAWARLAQVSSDPAAAGETEGRSRQRSVRIAGAAAFSLGLFILTVAAAPPGFYRKMFADRFGPVMWFSEGVSDTVAVCQHPDGSAWIHFSDGRGASGTTSFKGGWLYAHLPLLLHPNPESALVICFGTGNTLGAASLHPLERLDGVELSSEVVKASGVFKETNHDVARNPGVRMIIEDGRNYLLGTRHRYDVITEEPPMIHTAGVVNLYTRDFYRLCSDKLTDNGIMAVWLATWEIEDLEMRMLVRAFVDVFPHVTAWDSRHMGEWILIGSKQPLSVDPKVLAMRMAEPRIARDLAAIGIQNPADLLALHLKGGDFLRAFAGDTPPVTDDRTVVDFTIPRQARANFGLGEFLSGGLSVSGVGPSGLVSELRVREFDGIYTRRESVRDMVIPAGSPESEAVVREVEERQRAAEAESGRRIAWNLAAAAHDYVEIGRTDKAMDVLDEGLEMVTGAPGADLLVVKAAIYNRLNLPGEARETLNAALAINPTNTAALKMLTQLPGSPTAR